MQCKEMLEPDLSHKKMYELVEVPESGLTQKLPFSATANDLRGVIQFLRKYPDGVTLGEAIECMKKQIFEPLKIEAYETLGITARLGDRLMLTDFGKCLSEKMQFDVAAFRCLINRVEAYRGVLTWNCQQKSDFLYHRDVADYWQKHYSDVLGINTPKMTEANVACFFQLCQAAGLGTFIMGKKGQPSRLRFDRDEVVSFLASAVEVESSDHLTQYESSLTRIPKINSSSSVERMRVFVSASADDEIAEAVVTALRLIDFEVRLNKRRRVSSEPIPNQTVHLMRECAGAVIVISKRDLKTLDSGGAIDDSTQMELVASFVLYDGRVVLLLEEDLPIMKFKFAELAECGYSGSTLTWKAAAELMRAVKHFKL